MVESNNVKMKTFILILSLFSAALAHHDPLPLHLRHKRDAVGALDIVTNNAQPIHADVKPENLNTEPDTPVTEKPCPKSYEPSPIEMGTVFQVTPPKDVSKVPAEYPVTSLRKSWPLGGRLELIRSVTRIVTLFVLVVSAVFEFYPLVLHVFELFNP